MLLSPAPVCQEHKPKVSDSLKISRPEFVNFFKNTKMKINTCTYTPTYTHISHRHTHTHEHLHNTQPYTSNPKVLENILMLYIKPHLQYASLILYERCLYAQRTLGSSFSTQTNPYINSNNARVPIRIFTTQIPILGKKMHLTILC